MKGEILHEIQTPEDLKKVKREELPKLCEEIRARLIDVLAVTGGHLASNLGSVELTVALHRVFNSPVDKFIWDVSHQAYTHKILTGRNDKLPTIRQHKGLCGFTNPAESEHDHFHVGHAGTALSQALGMAHTRDILQETFHVIPIIGDATLTCGMSLEALNNLSRERGRFVILLNDNRMSISRNVGAITKILSRMLSNPTTHRFHRALDHLLQLFPHSGSVIKQLRRVSKAMKNLFSSAALLEHFGLTYMGPVDGHDVHALIDVFTQIKDLNSPVLVHVITTKGKGLEEAEKSPTTHHGAKPFDKVTGKFIVSAKNSPTFPRIFGESLFALMEQDPRVVVVTPAMSHGSCIDAVFEKFPSRAFDVGIAEAHAVTFSGALAHSRKLRVVTSIYSTFLQRGFDNLFQDVCLQEIPVVFAIDRGGLAGADGPTHDGIYDISFLQAMPNMVIAQPRNGQLLKELLYSAFDYGKPTAIRYPNLPTTAAEGPLQQRPIGQGELLIEGKDLLLIGLGHHTETALAVRSLLLEKGIHASVMDPIFVKPFDESLLSKLLLTHRMVVTIEEHVPHVGLGSILNNFIVTQGFNQTEVINFGVPERFVGHGSHKELMKEIGLTPEQIAKRVIEQIQQLTLEESLLP